MKSAFFHSIKQELLIKLPFDAVVAEKFLNVIWYIASGGIKVGPARLLT